MVTLVKTKVSVVFICHLRLSEGGYLGPYKQGEYSYLEKQNLDPKT